MKGTEMIAPAGVQAKWRAFAEACDVRALRNGKKPNALTGPQVQAIALECGLTEEDFKQIWREFKEKFS
jgi:hypothetical protein